MSQSIFQTIDPSESHHTLLTLHERVVHGSGRIELILSADNSVSVLISKEELGAIETALSMLADADCVKDLCSVVQRLAIVTRTHETHPTHLGEKVTQSLA